MNNWNFAGTGATGPRKVLSWGICWPEKGNHNILLRKSDYYGIRRMANEWFYSRKRKQFVSKEFHTSTNPEFLTIVLIESVLIPILIIININDLQKRIRYLKTYHFADNASITQSNSSLEILWTHINKYLSNLLWSLNIYTGMSKQRR